jgi:hypothetical protein
VSKSDPLAQGRGESLEALIHLLKAINPFSLDENEQTVLALSLSRAQKKLRAAPGTASPLERCKTAILSLSPQDREQLLLWIATDMKD